MSPRQPWRNLQIRFVFVVFFLFFPWVRNNGDSGLRTYLLRHPHANYYDIFHIIITRFVPPLIVSISTHPAHLVLWEEGESWVSSLLEYTGIRYISPLSLITVFVLRSQDTIVAFTTKWFTSFADLLVVAFFRIFLLQVSIVFLSMSL